MTFQFQTPHTGYDPNRGAVAGAYQQSQGAMRDALATVQPGRFVGSPFAQGLFSRFAGNAPGISEEEKAAHLRQTSRRAAQSESDQLRGMRQSAASGGFNFSAGKHKAEADIRARSADQVRQTEDQFILEGQQQKREQEAQSLAALMQLYGIEGGLAAQYANLQANRQFPVIPGVTPEGELPGGGYSFIDPGTGRMTNPPRTSEEWEQFYAERRAWEQQYGGGTGGGTGGGRPGYGSRVRPPNQTPGYNPYKGMPLPGGGYQSPGGGRVVGGSSPTPGSILMRMYGQ